MRQRIAYKNPVTEERIYLRKIREGYYLNLATNEEVKKSQLKDLVYCPSESVIRTFYPQVCKAKWLQEFRITKVDRVFSGGRFRTKWIAWYKEEKLEEFDHRSECIKYLKEKAMN